MLGHTHVLTGMAAWLAAGPPLLAVTGSAAHVVGVDLPPVSGTGMVAATLACGGAAMLPDIDKPGATIARTYWPIGDPLTAMVETLAGGHRKATHSVGFAVFAGVLSALALWRPWATAALVGVFVGLAVAGGVLEPLGLGRGLALPVTGLVGLAVWAMDLTADCWWLPWTVALGSLMHCAGDFITPGGVPWLWPSQRKSAFPLIEEVGNDAERGPWTVALTLVVVALIGWRVGLYSTIATSMEATR